MTIQSMDRARTARTMPSTHATVPDTSASAPVVATANALALAAPANAWNARPVTTQTAENASVLRRVTKGVEDRCWGRRIANGATPYTDVTGLRPPYQTHPATDATGPLSRGGLPLHWPPGMPRFRLGQYISSTFAVTDWRAFRLCGMDEVGRGAYAGPLVAAAVVLPPRFRHPLLRDSKLLTAHQREAVAEVLRRRAVAWAVAEVPVTDINVRGLGWANVDIFRRLVDLVQADGYCCDGKLRIHASHPVHCLVSGDRLVPAVSAASIIAKVHRDALMRDLHTDAPHYNWAQNKGYGAPEHRAAIREHGPHPEHRRVFLASVMQTELEMTAS